MGYFKINAVVPDNIMSSGQQVHKIYCRGNLIWEKEPEPLPQQNWEEVTIGNQTWMKYNLVIDDGQGGIYSYNNDIANAHVYGYLYTWEAAIRVAASIDGWHLPSDAEWQTLSDYLGGNSVAGGKLKETGTTHWRSPNNGATNETGFTALPGGYRLDGGAFDGIGKYGCWWSSTVYNGYNAYYWSLGYTYKDLYSYYINEENGYSISLIKDTP